MRLLALVAALLFTAGSGAAMACAMHTAGHGEQSQTVAQKPPAAQSGSGGNG